MGIMEKLISASTTVYLQSQVILGDQVVSQWLRSSWPWEDFYGCCFMAFGQDEEVRSKVSNLEIKEKSESVGWWSSRFKVLTLEEEPSNMQGDKRSLLLIQKARRENQSLRSWVLWRVPWRSSFTWIMLSFKEAFGQYWRTKLETCKSGLSHSKEADDEVNLLHVLQIVMYFSMFIFL